MASRPHGFTLVEMLVALALGLMVVACASVLLHSARLDSRRSVAEQRVLQDLRHAAEQIARNLRRAGHWGAAGEAAGSGSAANPYGALTAAGSTLSWRWSRDTVENGVVDTKDRKSVV